jgi:hypothetical protein
MKSLAAYLSASTLTLRGESTYSSLRIIVGRAKEGHGVFDPCLKHASNILGMD